MSRIRRSRYVRPDLLRIWRWIARDNRSAADRTLRRIDEAVRLITDFPETGTIRDDLRSDVRMMPIGNYLILYRIDQRGAFVLRVVHGAMDLSKIAIP
jgi:toxin ParE1/3/4